MMTGKPRSRVMRRLGGLISQPICTRPRRAPASSAKTRPAPQPQSRIRSSGRMAVKTAGTKGRVEGTEGISRQYIDGPAFAAVPELGTGAGNPCSCGEGFGRGKRPSRVTTLLYGPGFEADLVDSGLDGIRRGFPVKGSQTFFQVNNDVGQARDLGQGLGHGRDAFLAVHPFDFNRFHATSPVWVARAARASLKSSVPA